MDEYLKRGPRIYVLIGAYQCQNCKLSSMPVAIWGLQKKKLYLDLYQDYNSLQVLEKCRELL